MCIYCSVRILFLLCSFDRAFGDASVHGHKQQVSRFFCFPVLLIAQFGDLHGNGIILTFYIMKHFNFRQLFVAMAMLLCCMAVNAQQRVVINEIHYDVDTYNYTATVVSTGYGEYGGSSYAGDIVIPNAITFNGQGCRVTGIDGSAFYNCTGLTSISLGNNITNIGGSAFSGCTGLTSITIPNNV